MDVLFERLVQEALDAEFSGWDFAAFRDRWVEEPPPWDYRALVEERLVQSRSLLDMGTGGGEFLSSLQPLPAKVCATESYEPNIPVAREKLEPLGIQVVPLESNDHLPFHGGQFDLVINRHESFSAREVWRVLQPGGVFATQQVGGSDNLEINAALGAPVGSDYDDWTLQVVVAGLERSGFAVSLAMEAYPETRFLDIGAVVFYLRTIPWQIPGYRLEDYRDRLFKLHQRIESGGPLTVDSHRFCIVARKPC
jgi:SAM-dependent methyltransferase